MIKSLDEGTHKSFDYSLKCVEEFFQHISLKNIADINRIFLENMVSVSLPSWTLSEFSAVHDHSTPLGAELGRGAYGKVLKVLHRTSGNIYAMKTISKEIVTARGLELQVLREIQTQLRLKHGNVIGLHTYFEDKETIFMIMELADSGNLWNYMRSFPGRIVSRFVFQLTDRSSVPLQPKKIVTACCSANDSLLSDWLKMTAACLSRKCRC